MFLLHLLFIIKWKFCYQNIIIFSIKWIVYFINLNRCDLGRIYSILIFFESFSIYIFEIRILFSLMLFDFLFNLSFWLFNFLSFHFLHLKLEIILLWDFKNYFFFLLRLFFHTFSIRSCITFSWLYNIFLNWIIILYLLNFVNIFLFLHLTTYSLICWLNNIFTYGTIVWNLLNFCDQFWPYFLITNPQWRLWLPFGHREINWHIKQCFNFILSQIESVFEVHLLLLTENSDKLNRLFDVVTRTGPFCWLLLSLWAYTWYSWLSFLWWHSL